MTVSLPLQYMYIEHVKYISKGVIYRNFSAQYYIANMKMSRYPAQWMNSMHE